MVTWSVLPRNKDLTRTADPVSGWLSLTVIERHNVTGAAAGTWSIQARNEVLGGLMQPGSGVILFRDGDEVMSGDTTTIERGPLTSTISGISDTTTANDRILYPVPANAITNQGQAYDNRSGNAEDVLLGYLAANMGPAAQAARRFAPLRLPISQGRGAPVSITGRLEQLGTTLSDIAETGGLHFEILHHEDPDGTPYLLLSVAPVQDLSADVRFGPAGSFTGGVIGSDWTYTLARPTVTDAIVAGGGEGADRTFTESVDPAAEALWGRKIESLIDQRQTTDATELAQAGTDALSGGAAPVTVSFTITDSPDIVYRRDWRVGDVVGATIDGLDLTNPVREVTTTVTSQAGSPTEKISAVIGSRNSSAWITKTNADVARALQQLQTLRAS